MIMMMVMMMMMLNLDASWSSSSILLHMLVKLVSSSEGCRERFASNFILGVKKAKCANTVCGYRSALGSGWNGTESIALTI